MTDEIKTPDQYDISNMSERDILEARFNNDLHDAEQGRLGKLAQARSNKQNLQDRFENASFDLTKSWLQAGISFVGLSSAYISPKYQKHVKPVMEGLNQIFSAATSIVGASRGKRLANRSLEEENNAKTGTTETGNKNSTNNTASVTAAPAPVAQ